MLALCSVVTPVCLWASVAASTMTATTSWVQPSTLALSVSGSVSVDQVVRSAARRVETVEPMRSAG
jgi:hypothetical protein